MPGGGHSPQLLRLDSRFRGNDTKVVQDSSCRESEGVPNSNPLLARILSLIQTMKSQ
jgi:hypothetical protein